MGMGMSMGMGMDTRLYPLFGGDVDSTKV